MNENTKVLFAYDICKKGILFSYWQQKKISLNSASSCESALQINFGGKILSFRRRGEKETFSKMNNKLKEKEGVKRGKRAEE